MQRDARDISAIHKLGDVPRLLRFLAEYSGNLINLRRVGGELGLHHATVKAYVAVLENLYLVYFQLAVVGTTALNADDLLL